MFITLDYHDRRPIYEQVVSKVGQLIARDILKPHDKMPSVRTLAMELSVNPNTIQHAYVQLERQGYLYPMLGKGNFVAERSNWIENRTNSMKKDLSKVLTELMLLDISKQEIIDIVDAAFEAEGRERHDND